jgi:hypothetical protein
VATLTLGETPLVRIGLGTNRFTNTPERENLAACEIELSDADFDALR